MTSETAAGEGTFISHLIELRNRLVYSLIAIGVVFTPLAIFSQKLYSFLAQPLIAKMPTGTSMIATEVASPFLTPLKLAFVVSIVLSIPFLLYQVWAFVAPGLYRHERQLIFPLLASSTLLFYAGMTFAYFVVFPLVFGFLTSVAPEGVQVMTDIRAYLDFVFAMFLAFGIAFEVPIAVILLVRFGAVRPDTLASKRPYIVVWTFVIAMLLTPPDVISQTLLAIPMLLLFEIGLFVSRRIAPTPDEDEYREMTEAEMEAEFEKVDTDFDDEAVPENGATDAANSDDKPGADGKKGADQH